MRILHLTPELPHWPGGTGGSTRQFHLLRRLMELGHQVSVVAPVTPAQENLRSQIEGAGIRLVGVSRPPSRSREALAALVRDPSLAVRAATLPVLAWQVSVFWTSLQGPARAEVEDWRPDVLSVEHDYAGDWAARVSPDLPAVLTLENVSFAYYRSRADAASGLRRLPLSVEAGRFLRHDRRVLGRYRHLIACSEEDRSLLRTATDVPAEVVPNGVATDALAAQPDHDGAPTLLFSGTMNYPPNEEGIRWFSERVWPAIRAAQPDARLLVVGREPPPRVQALAGRDGIEVTGAVPDVSEYFRAATAVVVPIRSGGGTRLKVLEAFAARRAVVSTTVGVEGIAAEAGRHLLVEDDPSRFADAALELLASAPERARLAGEARALVERDYDWRALGDRFAAVLESVGDAPRPRATAARP